MQYLAYCCFLTTFALVLKMTCYHPVDPIISDWRDGKPEKFLEWAKNTYIEKEKEDWEKDY